MSVRRVVGPPASLKPPIKTSKTLTLTCGVQCPQTKITDCGEINTKSSTCSLELIDTYTQEGQVFVVFIRAERASFQLVFSFLPLQEPNEPAKMSVTDLQDRPLKDTVCLFDVDGTLSYARQSASAEMIDILARLRQKCAIGFVCNIPTLF